MLIAVPAGGPQIGPRVRPAVHASDAMFDGGCEFRLFRIELAPAVAAAPRLLGNKLLQNLLAMLAEPHSGNLPQIGKEWLTGAGGRARCCRKESAPLGQLPLSLALGFLASTTPEDNMAGHSKYKNIMHRKGAQDKKRSGAFSKLSREITVAAKMGAPDPDMNPRLRLAVTAAKAQSMPKDNIQRAIDKASAAGGEDYEAVRYEGYGPGGVALIVEALTDNRNRTATNMRTAFSRNGGNLGTEGSVSHGFERKGMIVYPAGVGSEDAVLEAAIEAGADDVESAADGHVIWTGMEALHAVAGALEAALGEAESVKLAWKPTVEVAVRDEDEAATLFKLIDALDDDDDVQTVWGNYDVSAEVLEKLDA